MSQNTFEKEDYLKDLVVKLLEDRNLSDYDILFDFPPPPGNVRFEANETVVYTITGAGLTANDFNVFGSPGPGMGNPGPFLSVARFQSTGPNEQGSDWVGAVPVPAAVWLFGSGVIGLVGVARRKRH